MAPIKLLAQVGHPYVVEGPGRAVGASATLTAEKIVSQLFGVLTIIAFLYFGIQVILAGYGYISSEGDKNKADTARKKLTDGIIGLVLVVVSLGLASLIAKIFGLTNPFDLNAFFTSLGL